MGVSKYLLRGGIFIMDIYIPTLSAILEGFLFRLGVIRFFFFYLPSSSSTFYHIINRVGTSTAHIRPPF